MNHDLWSICYDIFRIESLRSEKTNAEDVQNNRNFRKISRREEINESGDGRTFSYEESIIEEDELENLQRWAGAGIDENIEDTEIELEDVEDENIEDQSENVHGEVTHSEYRLVLEIEIYNFICIFLQF